MAFPESDREKAQQLCEINGHAWQDTYYGTQCTTCGLFYADGCAPWDDEIGDEDGFPSDT